MSGVVVLATEEAWKKRAFFPEDEINSNYVFHLCLLSKLDHGPLTTSALASGASVDHVKSSMVYGPSSKTKKPFIHNRDEEFSPRYHPVSFEGLKVASCRFFLQHETFQRFKRTLSR